MEEVKRRMELEKVQRRRELTVKLKSDKISCEETKELRDILNKELEEARDTNEALAFLAIFFLLGYVNPRG